MDDGSDVATRSFHGYDAAKYRTGKGLLGGKRGKDRGLMKNCRYV
ncbi:MAG: hypothetical protein J7J01_02095 [Methanophagales archaeon]|nr:hypothetical protein [Methanophagales archaeon]